jgi:hypothetical protein
MAPIERGRLALPKARVQHRSFLRPYSLMRRRKRGRSDSRTVRGLVALAGQDVTSCIEADSYSYMLGPQDLAIARVHFASAPLFSTRQDRGRRRYFVCK